MVEYVGEDGRKLGADALRNVDCFVQAEVHVPVRQATERAGAADPTCVQTQDRIAEQVVGCDRVAEHIGSEAAGANTIRTEHVVVARTALGVGTECDGVFSRTEARAVKEVAGIAFAVCLSLGSGIDLDRYTAARREDRRECPAAQNVSDKTLLALEERRLVHEEHVVDKLTIPRLNAVVTIQVEGVGGSV